VRNAQGAADEVASTKNLLKAYGIPIRRKRSRSPPPRRQDREKYRFSPDGRQGRREDILHKSDIGGVVLNSVQLRRGQKRPSTTFHARGEARSRAAEIEGMLIARGQKPTSELVVGASLDAEWAGWCCSNGGVGHELMKDVGLAGATLA